jgi:hypothetical protein
MPVTVVVETAVQVPSFLTSNFSGFLLQEAINKMAVKAKSVLVMFFMVLKIVFL